MFALLLQEPELIQMASQISGLENRLKFSRRDKDVTVSDDLCAVQV